MAVRVIARFSTSPVSLISATAALPQARGRAAEILHGSHRGGRGPKRRLVLRAFFRRRRQEGAARRLQLFEIGDGLLAGGARLTGGQGRERDQQRGQSEQAQRHGDTLRRG